MRRLRGLTIALLITLLGGCALPAPSDDPSAQSTSSQTSSGQSNTTWPSSSETSASDQPTVSPPSPNGTKTEVEAQPSPQRTSKTSPAQQPTGPVGVIITNASTSNGTLTVSALVSSLVEEGGQCTLTATPPNGAAITISGSAFADAQGTICDPLIVTPSTLTPGKWSLVVNYKSVTYGTYRSVPYPLEIS